MTKQPGAMSVVPVAGDGLDFEDVRAALLRIPEISLRIRSAQKVLDRERRFDVDLFSFMSTDHETFRRYPHLRAWVSEIVKDALCERLVRNATTDTPVTTRNIPILLNAVISGDPLLSWFWPSLGVDSALGPDIAV